MFLIGPPDGFECSGAWGSQQYICSMTSTAHSVNYNLAGKNKPISNGVGIKEPQLCIPFTNLSNSLRTYYMSKQHVPEGSRVHKTVRNHEPLRPDERGGERQKRAKITKMYLCQTFITFRDISWRVNPVWDLPHSCPDRILLSGGDRHTFGPYIHTFGEVLLLIVRRSRTSTDSSHNVYSSSVNVLWAIRITANILKGIF